MKENVFWTGSIEMERTFGDWLRAERSARNLTQEALAERIGDGLTHVAVGDWERGKRKPRPRNVDALADALAGPDADEETRDRLRTEARAAAAGIDLPELERDPDPEHVAQFLADYSGPDPAIAGAAQTYKAVRRAMAEAEEMPPSGEEL
jgi:transcriptional regulator with XRE-family HTH domain